ncbi:hypothetical protein BerOc1_03660 [Pseudodesulfovibrio hydrargyri]|uniref:Lysylphosphatidylglycerol synthase TM region n=1 Tax=Pseudodesulfovibrio hydrargyri TaxID=2125990 RepID=A0A1J5MZU5_9BACT|nr:hypothetical protein [Pseudodesulfovibrio hydrargyri]OIQ48907.1 hypothetical protein BerOc1_03660 [Pseudodesulfovibrio hydrargyri]
MPLKKILTILYLLAVALSCAWYINANLDALRESLSRIDVKWQLLSLTCLLPLYLSLLMNFVATQRRVEEPARKIRFSQWFCGFIYGHIGRYVPGKVAMIFGRIHFFERLGLSKKALTVSTLYENFFLVIVSIVLSMPALGAAIDRDGDAVSHFVTGIAFIALSLVFIGSPLFEKSFLLALRIFKREPPKQSLFLTKSQILAVLPYAFLVVVFTGCALFALLRSFAPLEWTFYNVAMVTSAYAFASAAGILALFAPSGIGVREGVAAYILGGCLHLVDPVVLVMALILFRVELMVVEFLLLSVAWLIKDEGRTIS